MTTRFMTRPKRWSAVLGAAAVTAFAIVAWAGAKAPTATWWFGRMQVTDAGDQGVRLYTSLHNHSGKPSQEIVQLFAVPAGVGEPRPKLDLPVADFSKHAAGKVGAIVVEMVLAIDPELKKADSYWFLLVVAGSVTDLMPMVDGAPVPTAPERKKAQK